MQLAVSQESVMRWYRLSLLFTFGPTAQWGRSLPHCWGFYITDSHTHPLDLLSTSDQPVVEATTYTTHNKHEGRTSMPSAGFEPAIPAVKRPQTYTLCRTATGIGRLSLFTAQSIPYTKYKYGL